MVKSAYGSALRWKGSGEEFGRTDDTGAKEQATHRWTPSTVPTTVAPTNEHERLARSLTSTGKFDQGLEV